jgi:peptidoglycan/xylan/chitin deacetylase (PgdA/CDA1 family)
MLGPGLLVAVVATFGSATLLIAAGLGWDVTQSRTVVVTEVANAAPVRVMSSTETQAVPESQSEAHDGDADSADPSGPHPVVLTEHADDHDHDHEADAPDDHATAAAGPALREAPTAEATPVPAPAVAAEPAPTPAAPTGRRPDPGPRGAPRPVADVPIVMYHHIGPLPPNADVFRKDLTVSPALFEDQLQRFADQGIETVSLDDLMEHYAGGPSLPKRATILTFDDGYDDNYEHAFPLLQQYGMTGTFFIVTEFVGRPGYLTWDQIKEMDAAGMSIEAHSASHADLSKVGPAELRRQLVEPKSILEEQLGHPIRFLAYPSGKYNAGTIAATRAAGYVAAVTVVHGTSHPASAPFEVTRVRARGADTSAALVARMTPPAWRR